MARTVASRSSCVSRMARAEVGDRGGNVGPVTRVEGDSESEEAGDSHEGLAEASDMLVSGRK